MSDPSHAPPPLPDSPAPAVVVVGGGPAALAGALGLARRGIRVVHVEVPDTSAEDFGPAWILHEATLERLARLGVADAVAARGTRWERSRVLYRGRDVAEEALERTGSALFADYAVAPREAVMEALGDALGREPGIERVTASRVLSATPSPGEGVRVTVELPSQHLDVVHGDFLLAADGGRSTARGCLGVSFPGADLEERLRFVVVRASPPFGRERRVVLQPPGGGVGFATPMTDDLWEVSWLVDDGSSAAAEQEAGRLGRMVSLLLEGADHTVVACGDRSLRGRVAAKTRVGPVLLAGAALRAVCGLGGWDVNDALDDAENAAWRLALVLRGLAPVETLDRYDRERAEATRASRERAEGLWRFLVPGSWTGLTARNALLSSPFGASGRQRSAGLRLWAPPRAAEGAERSAAGPVGPGDPAPDGPTVLLPRRTPGRFRELLGPGFSVVAFAGSRTASQEIGAWANTCATAAPVRFFLVIPPEQLLEGGHGGGFDAVLVDEAREIRSGFGVGPNESAAFVVRPDGYVGARIASFQEGPCAELLERVTGCHAEVRESGVPGVP